MTVVFIDTSVLCNILRVPGRDQRADAVIEELRARTGRGERFILPLTTVIETGNHVANIKPANHDAAPIGSPPYGHSTTNSGPAAEVCSDPCFGAGKRLSKSAEISTPSTYASVTTDAPRTDMVAV